MEVDREKLEELLKIVQSEDLLGAEKLVKIKRELKQLLTITVRKIAESIVRMNQPYYSVDLLQLIPKEVLNTEVTDKKLGLLEHKIDSLRFEKEGELAVMLQLDNISNDPSQMERFRKVINSKLNTLPKEQEDKRKEIKFLFNVAATMVHC